MSLIQVKAKKWGNSIGLLVPSEIAKHEKIRENQKLDIIILSKSKTLEKTFGMLKEWTKPTQQIKDEIKRDLHGR